MLASWDALRVKGDEQTGVIEALQMEAERLKRRGEEREETQEVVQRDACVYSSLSLIYFYLFCSGAAECTRSTGEEERGGECGERLSEGSSHLRRAGTGSYKSFSQRVADKHD